MLSLLSFLYSIFIIIGISFQKFKNLNFLFQKYYISIPFFLLLFLLFRKGIAFLFSYLDEKKEKKEIKKKGILLLFDQKPIVFSFLVLLIFFLPYMIAFYPAILSKDPSFQILQYFGIDNKYSYYSVLLDKNVIITNHHPVLHTLLLGGFVKIGMLFDSVNMGLFCYSIFQILVVIFTLSYSVFFLKQIGLSLRYRILVLGIYAICPIFPFYALSPVKDVLFSCIFLFYVISLYFLQKREEKLKRKEMCNLFSLFLLLLLFRNNGIHVFVLSFFPFLFLKHRNRFQHIFLFVLTVCFYLSYQNIILPFFHITPSSKREMLSIPFQQTARYVKYHRKEITRDEKMIIDKILSYDTLKDRYNPEKSDPVKNEFNKYSTKEDLNRYFKVWFQEGIKHPITYLEATLHNTYGYFYPFQLNWYFYSKFENTLNQYGFSYHYNRLSFLRTFFTYYGNIFPYLPVLGLLVNIGFSFWILLFMTLYLFYRKYYQELLFFLPSFIIFLVCIASPVNTYFRYALPNIMLLPTLFGIFLSTIKKEKNLIQ